MDRQHEKDSLDGLLTALRDGKVAIVRYGTSTTTSWEA
jgi:hypothetical protein